MEKQKPANIDEYILNAPPIAQEKLLEIRAILQQVAPAAVEAIKWGYPIFEQKRILFAFAAFKSHLNFMPTGQTLAAFKAELAAYKTTKDNVQFSYDKPLPKALIEQLASHRLQDVLENDAKWMY
ncbi:MAG: DUF1801 domain-containing protein [Saprospiraceae bacterium]|jgi:uncharacterized protein YdhG (YjbR/CyaY superfamily)|nr:DUF1801 domain-containing protein [Saprospiraceae bacterium]